MASFVRSVESAAHRAGKVFKGFLAKTAGKLKAVKEKVRGYRLFAKTKAAKNRAISQMVKLADGLVSELGKALTGAAAAAGRLRGYGQVARRKLEQLHRTVSALLPQIRYWLRTGYVATGKIINLHVPELYSVVRGKVGKTVEFGLSWGITRLRGGFILATLAS